MLHMIEHISSIISNLNNRYISIINLVIPNREGIEYISEPVHGETKGTTTFLPTVEQGSQSLVLHPLA
jgi:hypothetical protein